MYQRIGIGTCACKYIKLQYLVLEVSVKSGPTSYQPIQVATKGTYRYDA